MIIYINGKFLSQRLTGVQRYALEITKRLIQARKDVKILVPPAIDLKKVELPHERILQFGSFKNAILWEQIELPRYLKKEQNHVLVSLCNIGTLFSKRQIICVHDMSFAVNPTWFTRSFSMYYNFMVPRLVNRAYKVITVSEFSKREIQQRLRKPNLDISVIYNAPSERFMIDGLQSRETLQDDFFLFVGSQDPRKNLQLLLKLFADEEFQKERLIVVGGKTKSFNKVELQQLPNVEFKEKCDDTELSLLYRNAKALINPSLYEGFGLPLVEAMASGCLLILSDIEVFKEIAGGGALYFRSNSLDAARESIRSFLKLDKEKKADMRLQNLKRSRDFTWNNSTDKLLQVIDHL
ncbi:MAG: glycosyltransferase family 1 protein [Pseudosphingobacterium sp.]|nr:glycosyltransferase family 4 protein [Olivibacter sp. UJ_SKK_5.1]MDX3912869.1 glycosyltransferase family 1 protein [Pseudosphingobacterium sp.]